MGLHKFYSPGAQVVIGIRSGARAFGSDRVEGSLGLLGGFNPPPNIMGIEWVCMYNIYICECMYRYTYR